MSDEKLHADTAQTAARPPALPPRSPLSPPDEAAEHHAVEQGNEVADSYFPSQPESKGLETADGDNGTNGADGTSAGMNGHAVGPAHHSMPPQRRSRVREHIDQLPEKIDYSRDLKTLIGYVVPFPKPQLPPVGAHTTSQLMPSRFMIYTPPPPPFLQKPHGETKTEAWRKEGIPHWCRRKWYEELREAKMRTPKNGETTRWKRAKWKATRGTDWGIDKTKSSNLEFLNRVARVQDEADEIAESTYHKVSAPERIMLLYPPDMKLTVDGSHEHDQELLSQELISSLSRTRKRATRDTIISALLFAPAIVVDTFAVVIWPFGGLAEIDAVWFYASFRGAKTSHGITKRLTISSNSKHKERKLDLTFSSSPRIDVLSRYLAARCHDKDSKLFPEYVPSPSDTEVLAAIGWKHSDETLPWEDRQWELQQIKDDLERTFGKAAREWAKWCKLWIKDPEKASKK